MNNVSHNPYISGLLKLMFNEKVTVRIPNLKANWQKLAMLLLGCFIFTFVKAQNPNIYTKPSFKDTSLNKYWFTTPIESNQRKVHFYLLKADSVQNKIEKGEYIGRLIPMAIEINTNKAEGKYKAYLKEYPPKKGKISEQQFLFVKGYYNDMIGNYDSAAYYYEAGTLCPVIENKEGYLLKGNLHLYLGLILSKGKSPGKASYHIEKGIEFGQKTNDYIALGYCFLNAATAYGYWGTLEETCNFYRKAEEYFTKGKSEHLLRMIYNNMSNIYSNSGNADSAFYYARKAIFVIQLKTWRDSIFLTSIYHTLAEAFNKFNQPDSALHYLKIVNKYKPAGIIDQELDALVALEKGRAYMATGRYNEAKKEFKAYYLFGKKGNDFFIQSQALSILADASIQLKDFQAAAQCYITNDSLQKQYNHNELKNEFGNFSAKLQNELNKTELAELKLKELLTTQALQERNLQFKYALATLSLLIGLLMTFVLLTKYLHKKRDLLAIQTAEIAQQTAQLEELGQTKDKLFSIIAHDLRGPIGSMKNLPDLLGYIWETSDKASIAQFSGTLKRSIGSVYDLLESLLAWAQVQTGEFKLNPKNVELAPLLDRVLALYEGAASPKQVRLKLKPIADDLSLFTDSDALQTILRNVVNNAIKFSKPNTEVTLSVEEDVSGMVVFSVQDQGIGMSQETVAQLFKVGKKHIKEGTSGEKSSGLGLVLVKDLIEALQGKISIQSEEGKGTLIKIYIGNYTLAAGELKQNKMRDKVNKPELFSVV